MTFPLLQSQWIWMWCWFSYYYLYFIYFFGEISFWNYKSFRCHVRPKLPLNKVKYAFVRIQYQCTVYIHSACCWMCFHFLSYYVNFCLEFSIFLSFFFHLCGWVCITSNIFEIVVFMSYSTASLTLNIFSLLLQFCCTSCFYVWKCKKINETKMKITTRKTFKYQPHLIANEIQSIRC